MTQLDPSAAQPDPAGAQPVGRSTLLVVFMTVFLDLLGFGLIIPTSAFYAEAFGARPALITVLGASYSLMQFLFMPYWGRVSDRIGRRPVILFSVAISCVGFLLFGLATSVWMLFAARLLSGFGNANIAVAQAVIADTTTPANRVRGMGMIGAAFGLGFIIGPAVGGSLGQISLATPALVAAGLAAVNWALAFFLLPETRRIGTETAHARLSFAGLREVRGQTNVGRLLTLSLLITTGFALMEQVMGLYFERVWVPTATTAAGAVAGHKHAALLTTYAMVVVGVTMTVVQGGLIGPLAKRFGEGSLLRVGTVLLVAGLLGLPLAGQLGLFGMIFPAVVLLALGSGLTTPSISSLLSRSTDVSRQGSVLGMGQSLSSLGRVIGPMVAGALFEVQIGLPFLVGAGLMVIAVWLAWGLVGGGHFRKPAAG